MANQSDDVQKTSRRSFAKLIAAVLTALPIAALTGEAGGKPQKRRKMRQARPEQTSPITIGGGGSVGIDFNSSYYKRVGATNVFRGPQGDKLHKLWVTDKFGAKWDRTPGSSNCRIVVHCEKIDSTGNPIPGTDSPITVYGLPLAVEINTADYDFVIPPGGDKEIYYNEQRKITGNIEVWVGNAPRPPHQVPTGGRCIIDFLNSY